MVQIPQLPFTKIHFKLALAKCQSFYDQMMSLIIWQHYTENPNKTIFIPKDALKNVLRKMFDNFISPNASFSEQSRMTKTVETRSPKYRLPPLTRIELFLVPLYFCTFLSEFLWKIMQIQICMVRYICELTPFDFTNISLLICWQSGRWMSNVPCINK